MITNFLTDIINNPEGRPVYIGYTSYTKKKVTTTNSGVWLGWREGRPFFEMRFRAAFPKQKFSADMWTYFKSCTYLFQSIWGHTDKSSPPIVLISSKKATRFLTEAQYKWTGLGDKEKSEMYFWMNALSPEIRHFDVLMPPFSMLRELMLKENVHIVKLITEKKFFDYSEFN